MATVSELQSQLSALRSEMERERRKSMERAAQIEADNKTALHKLKQQTVLQLAEDRKNTELSYEKLLTQSTAEMDEKLAVTRRKLQAQYDELTKELDRAIREESRKIRDAEMKQRNFEENYNIRLKKLEADAREAINNAAEEFRRFEREMPVEWFLPDRCTHYRRQLEKATELEMAGFYEAAIGVSDNLALSVSFDEINVQSLFRKWYRNFIVLANLVKNEHDLLINQSRIIEGYTPEFYSDEGISDSMLDEAALEFWIDKEFFNLKSCHEKDYDLVCGISQASIITDDDEKNCKEIMRFMSEKPELSEQYTAELMYYTVKNAEIRLAQEVSLICAMKSRINAFAQRNDICGDICDIMYECNLGDAPISSFYENDDKRRSIIAVFSDEGGYVTSEIHIVPVFCNNENKWYNCIGFSVDSPRASSDVERNLERMLKEHFEADGIMVSHKHSDYDETTAEQRTNVFISEFRRIINGHL